MISEVVGWHPIGESEPKRDLEAEISRAREKLIRNQNFENAITEYTNSRCLSGKFAELFGELVSESRNLERRIAELIDLQAKEQSQRTIKKI